MGKIHDRFKTGQTKRHVVPEHLKKLPAGKGRFMQNCNVTACLTKPAGWFNKGTNAYYCRRCATDINHFPVEGIGPLCTDKWEEVLTQAANEPTYDKAVCIVGIALVRMPKLEHIEQDRPEDWAAMDRWERKRLLDLLYLEVL